ncbi:MAG TPA: hypothetical protein VE258_06435 [Ktedonobacterales bacterium]|nr:hypothetical protein [Ktedonobacterales bacterium]
MADNTTTSDRPARAITDLYDEQKREFLVQYPTVLIVALGLAGVVAFMLVGFLGYRDRAEPAFTQTVFHQPWPLYLYFCALVMALQISIFRHPLLRRQLVATLTVTTISVILVGLIYYYNVELQRWLQDVLTYILGRRVLLRLIGDNKYTYNLLNLLLLAVFWVDTLRRWVRRARGLPPATHEDIDLVTGTVRPGKSTDEMPSLQELISGDLIAGGVLTLLLSLFFHADVLNFLSTALGTNVTVHGCNVSWLLGNCVEPGGGLADPPTISFIDVIQTLIYLPLGLLALALSATLSGFGAVGGVNEDVTNPVPASAQGETGTGSVSEQVTLTLINTLRSALNRRLRLAADNLAMSLRNVVWPVLIFFGIIAVATAAHYIQLYLHLLSDSRTCPSFPSSQDCVAATQLLDNGQHYQAVALAPLWGVVAVLAIVFSATLLIFKWRVAENTLRFLGLIGFIVLLTFWLFSLALSGFNGLFSLTRLSSRVPFPQPGLTTILSAASLVVFGITLLFRRLRGPGGAAPAKVPAPVGSETRR